MGKTYLVCWCTVEQQHIPSVDYYEAFVGDKEGAEKRYDELLLEQEQEGQIHSISLAEVIKSTDYGDC